MTHSKWNHLGLNNYVTSKFFNKFHFKYKQYIVEMYYSIINVLSIKMLYNCIKIHGVSEWRYEFWGEKSAM